MIEVGLERKNNCVTATATMATKTKRLKQFKHIIILALFSEIKNTYSDYLVHSCSI